MKRFSLCLTCVSCAGVRERVRWPCRKHSRCLRVWTFWRGKWKMRLVNWRPWPAPNKPSPRGSTPLRWACCLCSVWTNHTIWAVFWACSCFVNGRTGWRILTRVRRERRTLGLFWENPGRSRISAKIPRSERISCAAWARSPASPPNSPSSRERTYLSTSPLGMGDIGLKIYHNISGIYCDKKITMTMFNSYWKPEGALVQKLHICITEVILPTTLHEISNMDKGIQLSLNKTHNGDRVITFNWWNLKIINMVYLCSSSNLGYFFKRKVYL